MVWTWERIAAEWRDLKHEFGGGEPKRQAAATAGFLSKVFGPEPQHRAWFVACRDNVGTTSPELENYGEIAEMLDFLGEDWAAVANLHVEVVRQITHWPSQTAPDASVVAVAESAGIPVNYGADENGRLPVNFVRDLAVEMCSKPRPPEPQKAVNSESVTVLLIDMSTQNTPGVTARLTVEMIDPGQGVLYPTPSLAFVYRDDDWLEAEQEVRAYADSEGFWKNSDEIDVRWSIRRQDGRPLFLTLANKCAGAGFGLAIAKLFAGHP
jgi:hypothetical protein